MTKPEPIAVLSPVRRARRNFVHVEAQLHNSESFALVSIRTHMSGELPRSHQRQELCSEADEACSSAIPRQSVTVGGYLRAGEKETPRERRAQILGGIYAHFTRGTISCKPLRHERLVHTEAAMRAAENPKVKGLSD